MIEDTHRAVALTLASATTYDELLLRQPEHPVWEHLRERGLVDDGFHITDQGREWLQRAVA